LAKPKLIASLLNPEFSLEIPRSQSRNIQYANTLARIMKKMKFALVKQEVYQDLYVCDSKEKSALKILLSSMGRVGPIGLMAELQCDFFIIKEELNKETQIYKKVIPHICKDLQLLKTKTLDKLPNQGFTKPGSSYPNGKFAVSGDSIDWSEYDVVISINISLKKEILSRHPKTLFCYMIGEANLATEKALYNYDITLNQQARGQFNLTNCVIDFPYTFLKGNTLEKLFSKKYSLEKSGIYIEVNSCTDRPVEKIPEDFEYISKKTNQAVRLHKQLIEENLLEIYNSKFFVKFGGRKTRGNGAVEAISIGTLVLMNPDDIIHKEILPKEVQFTSKSELIKLIVRLNQDEKEYNRILQLQRSLVSKYFFDIPLENLSKALEMKRNGKLNKNLLKRCKNALKRILH
jgi:hypothetical protein